MSAPYGVSAKKVQAVLKGFQVGYTDGDHPIWKLEVDLKIENITGNTVTVGAGYLIRDHTGHIDDRFGGEIQVVVIADVA